MSSSISTVNRIERNIKRNTMLFIIQHLRKTSENFVIILNLLKKLSDIEFNIDDETKIVSDFNNFKKSNEIRKNKLLQDKEELDL